jgi:short-subunit dehydrogenase
MKVIRGKKALVTGAGSGIGKAIALELARQGVDLFLVDIDQSSLDETTQIARQLGVNTVKHCCDLADAAQIQAAVDRVQQDWGVLHILVNNAGITFYGRTEDMSADQWERLLAVNLLAPTRLIYLLLPMLRGQDEAHILNICSIAGIVPSRKLAAYITSKHGLVGLSLALRAEYNGRGLGVTALCPGLVKTNLFERARRDGMLTSKIPNADRLATTSEHVARCAIQGIRRNRRIVLITWSGRLYCWTYRWAASLIDWRQQRRGAARKSTVKT